MAAVKPSTMSLFEQEMNDQLAAAREALTEAQRRNDPMLVQAAAAHFEGLIDLARRNGVLRSEEPGDESIAEPLATPAG